MIFSTIDIDGQGNHRGAVPINHQLCWGTEFGNLSSVQDRAQRLF